MTPPNNFTKDRKGTGTKCGRTISSHGYVRIKMLDHQESGGLMALTPKPCHRCKRMPVIGSNGRNWTVSCPSLTCETLPVTRGSKEGAVEEWNSEHKPKTAEIARPSELFKEIHA
jgi:hypothetical protein